MTWEPREEDAEPGLVAVRKKFGPKAVDLMRRVPTEVYSSSHGEHLDAGCDEPTAREIAERESREAEGWLTRVTQDPDFAILAWEARTRREARNKQTYARMVEMRRARE